MRGVQQGVMYLVDLLFESNENWTQNFPSRKNLESRDLQSSRMRYVEELSGWRCGVVVSGVRQRTKLTHVGPGYNWDG